jgi:predicted ribosome quality control (RQC) complex YloA/Tae2 family protein
MSGLDLRVMLHEMGQHLPYWIGKIYQYDPQTFGIRLNSEDKGKYFFIIEAGRRAHFTGELPESPPNPSGYSMLLRKYLLGGKVLAIRQHGLQRIFEIVVGKKETTYQLIVELFDEGNLVLCDHDYRIIKPLRHHRFRDRELVPGVTYEFPGPSRVHVTEEEMQGILGSSSRDLVRTLAVELMLGGRYAEEICRIAGVDKNGPAAEADVSLVTGAYEAFLKRVEEEKEPVITQSGCWPYLSGSEEAQNSFPSYNEALDAFFPKTEKEIKQEKKPRLTREEVIRRQQEAALEKFEKNISRYESIVERIYANYTLVANVIETLDTVSRERSWQEIEEVLKKSDNPVAKAVAKVYPAESAVDLAIDGTVKIFVHETLEQNVGRYYDQIKKFKKKRAGAIVAMEKPLAKKTARKREFVFRKPRWYHRFRWAYTSDGILLLGGRDAGQNEELVKKYLEGGDTFLHADVHGASVVLLKGKTERMDEVAQFTASYSNAWKSGHFTADVYAVGPDQVSKTPESGEFVARGSFIIRGERRWFRDVPLSVAIGVQFEPSVGVIGGPVTAVAQRARVWVVLKPGTYEPNDAAKKVLRILRQQLAEDEWKSLKNVLNTEAVAAFVPPGGSDITETHES